MKLRLYKTSLSCFFISCVFHAGILIGIPEIKRPKEEIKTEDVIEVEYFKTPKIMLRAKNSKAKEADPFSKDTLNSQSLADDSVLEDEMISDLAAKKLVKKQYRAGMDELSYADLLGSMISCYLHKTVKTAGTNHRVRLEFTLLNDGSLLSFDIPYGYESHSEEFNLEVLNAITLASAYFPPLPDCVKKNTQNFSIIISQ